MANYPPYNYYPQTPMYQQQAPQQMQQIPMQQMQQPGFTVRGVTSKEEALAAQADYMSAGHVMPDLAHGLIYVKKPNLMTGACDFLTFRLTAPQEEKTDVAYVTVEEFMQFKEQLKGELKKYVESNDTVNRNA